MTFTGFTVLKLISIKNQNQPKLQLTMRSRSSHSSRRVSLLLLLFLFLCSLQCTAAGWRRNKEPIEVEEEDESLLGDIDDVPWLIHEIGKQVGSRIVAKRTE